MQLGAAGGGEGSVWVGEPGEDSAEDSPALGGFAPTPADRQRFLHRHHWHIFLSRWRAAGQLGKQVLELAVSWFREPLRAAALGAVRFQGGRVRCRKRSSATPPGQA